MNYFWMLIAMLALAYFTFIILRRGGSKSPKCVTPLPRRETNSFSTIDNHDSERKVKWITERECELLLRRSGDIVFVDMRSKDRTPIPFTVREVLVLNPSQVYDLLRWLPASSSVVLYGASNLFTSVLWSTRHLNGWAPIYVLDLSSGSRRPEIKCPA